MTIRRPFSVIQGGQTGRAVGALSAMRRREVIATAAACLAARVAGSAQASSSQFSAALHRAESLDQLRALVIADRHGVLAERSFRGASLARPVNVKSVSKSLVALLTGVAVDRGLLPGPEATLGDLAPQLIPASADPKVAHITIGNLLTLQAGLERTSGANYGGWVSSGDWVADALSRPFVAAPGAQFLYSTGSTHVLGAVLALRTGRSLHDLSSDWIGRPLQIDLPPWTRDPQGRYLGGNNMSVSPRGLARIGQALLNDGLWSGQEVFPSTWISKSWRPRTRSPFSGHAYGYGWFLVDTRATRVAYARGYGGQMLYVAPEVGVTVAITSDPTRPARSRGYAGDLFALFSETVLTEFMA